MYQTRYITIQFGEKKFQPQSEICIGHEYSCCNNNNTSYTILLVEQKNSLERLGCDDDF